MKKLLIGAAMALSLAANAGLWEGLTEENHVSGPSVTEHDLLGKVVVVYICGNEDADARTRHKRAEDLWKAHDKKRFVMVGSFGKEAKNADAWVAKRKISFPCYKEFRLASDNGKYAPESMIVVSPYGKVVVALSAHGGDQDFEQFLVEEITKVGMPPDLLPGVTLVKYKGLKTKIVLGKNLKGVVKQLEKDVAAADKKSATAAVKDKAAEASSIISAISEGKSEISGNITALTDINPSEALRLLSLYVKSFPEEAAENKEKLAELKVKAAEFKRAAKAKPAPAKSEPAK